MDCRDVAALCPYSRFCDGPGKPVLETLQTQLYTLEHWADGQVLQQLNHLSPLSVGVMLLAGLLTSLTPCMLSMLPITLGYIGGYGDDDDRGQAAVQSLWFAAGLATTLAGLGVAASLLGKIYGQIGLGLPIAVSVIAILMGLNLLEVLPLRLPGFSNIEVPETWPKGIRSYALGLTFGLIASPCSTPVLATLLAWISTSGKPGLGGFLLLCYALGYVLPIVLAGTFVGTLKRLLSLRQWSGWINPTSGVLLIGFGVFSLLTRLFPVV